jgi:hypothetical protein
LKDLSAFELSWQASYRFVVLKMKRGHMLYLVEEAYRKVSKVIYINGFKGLELGTGTAEIHRLSHGHRHVADILDVIHMVINCAEEYEESDHSITRAFSSST